MVATSTDGNRVEVDPEQCKGCHYCVDACKRGCLVPTTELNALGFQPVRFEQRTCTACGLCYYVCPEPGAITVHKAD